MLDQVYPVSVETASKDIQLGFKHVLHVIQLKELKTQVFKGKCLVYLATGANAGIWLDTGLDTGHVSRL